MTPENFAYWLQGFAEINGGAPNEQQWQIIQNHLKLLFEKKTPDYSYGGPIRTSELRMSDLMPGLGQTMTC